MHAQEISFTNNSKIIVKTCTVVASGLTSTFHLLHSRSLVAQANWPERLRLHDH